MNEMSQGFEDNLATHKTAITLPFLANKTMGPVAFDLELDGDIIDSMECVSGYCSRGVEKTMESLTWTQAIPIAARLNPEAAFFAELAYVTALESLMESKISHRVILIRVLISELSRISAHLKYLVEVAFAVETQTIAHLLLRDREVILDLIELLSGARFFSNILRPGGLAADVSEGFLDRTLHFVETLKYRIKEYNDLFIFNQSFLKRATHLCVIDENILRGLAASGPNLRAAGVNRDSRKFKSSTAYAEFNFEIPLGRGKFGALGDTYERVLVRVYEILESLDIIKQCLDKINALKTARLEVDSSWTGREEVVVKGEAISRVESPAGELVCYLLSAGDLTPGRVWFRSPSIDYWWILPQVVKGESIEDLPLILASLQISAQEVEK